MIKDVPVSPNRSVLTVLSLKQNKVSRQELVDILNGVVRGEFDFVYLRFDFKNCCNVSPDAYVKICFTCG